MNISVIIPIYNEKHVIKKCLDSLTNQTKKHETVIVDDGSTDRTLEFLRNNKLLNKKIKILSQSHSGPGAARNFGEREASGEILVFVDADMTFVTNFLEKLVDPIVNGKSKGTFTREEYVANWENIWARCWNYNSDLFDQRRIPVNYPNESPVFRAILTSEFKKVKGFDTGVGWTDDWSLSQKLGYKSTATDAKCFHSNPDSLNEVFYQARWIGKNDFLSGNLLLIIINSIRFSFVSSIIIGFYKALIFQTSPFIIFKLIYNFGITTGLLESIFSKNKNK